jgi:hypothetical protein
MSSIEEFYANHYDKERFLDIVREQGIDIEKTSVKKKQYNEHYHKFNILLDKMKSDNQIKLFDVCMYLYEDYFDKIPAVMACFDENNSWNLKEEVSASYHKKSVKSLLDSFLFT